MAGRPLELSPPGFDDWWAAREGVLEMALTRAVASMPTSVDLAMRYELKDKARRGWVRHSGGILYMPAGQVEIERRAEVLDLVVYTADLIIKRSST